MQPSTNRATRIASITARLTGETLESQTCGERGGSNAGKVAALAASELPVEPALYSVFVFRGARAEDMPLLVDPSIYVPGEQLPHHRRGRGRGAGEQAADPTDFEPDWSLFGQRSWPVLAARIPITEAIRMTRAWVGHYDYNVLDRNAVIGPHPQVANFIFANGFSGHGLQQAPAAEAKALAELIVHGQYRTIDCRAFPMSGS